MEGLQRSAVSFRRQGSSGSVFDDRFLKELNQMAQKQDDQKKQAGESDHVQEEEKGDRIKNDLNHDQGVNKGDRTTIKPISVARSRSNGGIGYRTGKVSPAIEPPSPKVSACGFCSAFGKPSSDSKTRPAKVPPVNGVKSGDHGPPSRTHMTLTSDFIPQVVGLSLAAGRAVRFAKMTSPVTKPAARGAVCFGSCMFKRCSSKMRGDKRKTMCSAGCAKECAVAAATKKSVPIKV